MNHILERTIDLKATITELKNMITKNVALTENSFIERFNFHIKLPREFKNHQDWIVSNETFPYTRKYLDDRHIERYETIKDDDIFIELCYYIEELEKRNIQVEDLTLNQYGNIFDGEYDISFDVFEEYVSIANEWMLENLGSFTYDW